MRCPDDSFFARLQVSSISSANPIRLTHASFAEDTLHFTPHCEGSVGDVLGRYGASPLGDLSDHWWRQVQVVDGWADGQAGKPAGHRAGCLAAWRALRGRRLRSVLPAMRSQPALLLGGGLLSVDPAECRNVPWRSFLCTACCLRTCCSSPVPRVALVSTAPRHAAPHAQVDRVLCAIRDDGSSLEAGLCFWWRMRWSLEGTRSSPPEASACAERAPEGGRAPEGEQAVARLRGKKRKLRCCGVTT